jgi:molecular chaperone Hsp33
MRDSVIKGTSSTLRFALVSCGVAAETARVRWGVKNPSARALLGKALSASSLLACFLKGEERLQLHWLSGGAGAAVSEIYVEAMPVGEVRGYVRGEALAKEEWGGWDGTLGREGVFSVGRALYGSQELQRSTLEFARGDITSEIESYYERSEQRASSVRLDATVEASGGAVRACTGMLLEALPEEGGLKGAGGGQPQCTFEALSGKLRGSESPWPPGLDAPAAALAIAPSLQWGRRVPLDYFCRCTTDGFFTKLVGSCSPALLQQLVEESVGGVAATLLCHFCNKSHKVDKTRLEVSLLGKGA